jgi:WD40 repeat protein
VPSYQDDYTFDEDDRRLASGNGGGKTWLWDVTGGREFCTFHGHSGYQQPVGVDIHPDGRLMVSTDDNGIRLWNVSALREWDKRAMPTLLDAGHCWNVFFDASGDNLITAGKGGGVRRWPVVRKDERLEIGPPQSIAPGRIAALSLDGRTAASVLDTGQALVFDLNDPQRRTALQGHSTAWRALETLQLSPDGEWAAGAGFHNTITPVWNARTGELVKPLPAAGRSWPLFSPDGRWLTTGYYSGEARFWEIATWRPAHAVPPKKGNTYACVRAFSRDGKMAAVVHHPTCVIQLIDPATGREFATLEPPDPQDASGVCFSSDGSRLAVACRTQVIQVWDLRLIRRQLKDVGLDWDLPSYEPAKYDPSKPLHIEVLKAAPPKPAKEPDAGALFRRGQLPWAKREE